MNTEQKKVVQYLNEAEASERALARVLQSQIAMTPSGSYRAALETHLEETRRHGDRVAARLQALEQSGDPLGALVGVVDTTFGQALALTKVPFDLLRGSGGAEKVLKNAKDACASEALEIATYTAIERLAQRVGDQETARLAASIRVDEERMLERILSEIPRLTDAVVRGELADDPSYDVAEAEGAADSAGSLAIEDYDELTPAEIAARLAELSQIDLAKIYVYERKTQNRPQILSRLASLRGDEPWAGYDDLSADEVIAVLREGDGDRSEKVRSYEHAHKNRAAVRHAAARALSNA